MSPYPDCPLIYICVCVCAHARARLWLAQLAFYLLTESSHTLHPHFTSWETEARGSGVKCPLHLGAAMGVGEVLPGGVWRLRLACLEENLVGGAGVKV